MNIAALAACGAALLALMPVGAEPIGTSTVFMKTLAAGHVVTVRSSEREEYVDVSKEERAKLPDGTIAVAVNVTRYEYVAYLGRPASPWCARRSTCCGRAAHTRAQVTAFRKKGESLLLEMAKALRQEAVAYETREGLTILTL